MSEVGVEGFAEEFKNTATLLAAGGDHRPGAFTPTPIFDSNPGYPPPKSLILGQKRGIRPDDRRNVVPQNDMHLVFYLAIVQA
ncbi:MAG: hypothetical protein NTZ17_04090 [Phycisphaerae bacterium]|nr:hypothetical protein [Phycisphaerae bacterium]